MNGLTKDKLAAILIAIYTLHHLPLLYNWIVADSPVIADMGVGFALSLFGTLMSGFMTVFGVWQDQKVYKIIAMIIFGVNALGALPGILFASTWGWWLAALSAVVLFVALIILLLRRTPQPVTA